MRHSSPQNMARRRTHMRKFPWLLPCANKIGQGFHPFLWKIRGNIEGEVDIPKRKRKNS
jgi:hypothetical protein